MLRDFIDWLAWRPWRDWGVTGARWLRNAALALFAAWLIAIIVLGGSAVNLGNFVVKLAVLFVAAELLFLCLRRLDRRIGIKDFKSEVWDVLASNPVALAIYRAAILVTGGLIVAAALSGCAMVAMAGPAEAASVLPSKYDPQIRRAANRFMGPCEARWESWWGQIMTESAMDPAARSPAGAEGLAQFMPGTAVEMFPLLGYQALDRRLAGPSIDAGAYYMGRLCGIYSSPRPPRDRHALGAASYNAGAGNILAAQRACGGALLYAEIMRCLPRITGRHAAETLAYWPRIELWARRKMGLA